MTNAKTLNIFKRHSKSNCLTFSLSNTNILVFNYAKALPCANTNTTNTNMLLPDKQKHKIIFLASSHKLATHQRLEAKEKNTNIS